MRYFISGAAMCALIGAATVASGQTSLFYGEASPNRGARAEALEWFVNDVEQRTDGNVKIDVHWGGALFKAGAAAPSIGDGVADLGTVIAVYFPQQMIAYGIADLPLRNPDAWVGMRATDELMRTSETINQQLASQNLVYIGTFTTSAVHIGCTGTSIKSVNDIEGLKVRGVGAYGKTFRDVGANLVSMSIYEAYQGLDTGLIDCSQGYSYAITALKQQEVLDSYTLLDWGQVGGLGIFMNKDAYERLEPEAQKALTEAGKAMADEYGRIIVTANEKAVATMKEAGVEIIDLPDEDRKQLIEKGSVYIDEWIERADTVGLDGKGLLTEYRELIDKYTSERDEKGYPWERQ